MENFIFMLMSLIAGILFIWYSQHDKSYEKTAAVQGEETAKKKFRLIKLCGYLLVLGSGIFGIFLITDMLNK
jgi:hypothetical protein